MRKIIAVLIFISAFSCIGMTVAISEVEKTNFVPTDEPWFWNVDISWVDSVMNQMTLDQKIAQLIMIPVYSNKTASYNSEVVALVEKYQLGGVIFMQGGPGRQINLVNRLQKVSKVPLLVGMDAEWSLSMRLDSVVLYPRQMLVGAISNNALVYDMGAEYARQLKRVGANVNFAPVIDVNVNPANPVINDRSFGENKRNVAEKGWMYAKGMQDNGVLAVGKHFPGHGDTNVDSHKAMPVITHDRARLDSIELYPFRYLSEKGVGGMMVSHLFVPAIDSTENLPASLSPKAVKQVLRKDVNFNGMVFTDAMNMGGITTNYKGNEADVMALLAGNDMIMFPTDVKDVIEKLKSAISEGKISEREIDEACNRVLLTKLRLGLNKGYEPISTKNVYVDLNDVQARLMQQKLIENAMTLAKNQDSLVPLMRLDSVKIASVSFESTAETFFQKRLRYYADVENFVYSRDLKGLSAEQRKKKLSSYDIVIVSVHGKNQRSAAKKFGISQATVDGANEILASCRNVVFDLFANPYGLAYFSNIDSAKSVIVSYNDWEITNDFSAQLIFGGIPANGVLPVSATENIKEGMGEKTQKIRLKYSKIPEDAGVKSEVIQKVDSIFRSGLNTKAYPGGQVVLVRNGIVIYQKSMGYHTYEEKTKVDDFDVYDLASLTKVIATTSDIITLYDEGKFTIKDKVSDYYDLWKNSNKSHLTFEQVLTHRSGLRSWIPFYKKTMAEEVYPTVYSYTKSEKFSIQVAENMYMAKSYKDEMFRLIRESALENKGKYVYSDLGFIVMPYVIENLTGEKYVEYTYRKIFAPLGAYSLCFNPLDKYDKENIVPTEDDNYFRMQLLHGHVHDQAAAMLGGVSGHAGLFGTANDLAKIMEIYLENGKYGGVQYFSDTAVQRFTEYHYEPTFCRRALCWDKPVPDRTKGNGSKSSSDKSFGHTGYTGTLVWADPEYNMAVVVLTNRVHTTSENGKIMKQNIRTNIEEALYNAIVNK
ncbi:MAG: serine hydrolase [Bacteroidales bacterium]|nr:serine hydrolase [Bacteroidales bacterium]